MLRRSLLYAALGAVALVGVGAVVGHYAGRGDEGALVAQLRVEEKAHAADRLAFYAQDSVRQDSLRILRADSSRLAIALRTAEAAGARSTARAREALAALEARDTTRETATAIAAARAALDTLNAEAPACHSTIDNCEERVTAERTRGEEARGQLAVTTGDLARVTAERDDALEEAKPHMWRDLSPGGEDGRDRGAHRGGDPGRA